MSSEKYTTSDKDATKFPLVSITNNLSHSIEIYDVFDPGDGNVQVPYVYTNLGTVTPGKTKSIQTIHIVSQLLATSSVVINDINNLYFDRFPIKIMSALQFSFDDPPPIEYSVESIDKTAMIQSLLFHRYTMANPDSALTKNLYAALKKGTVEAVNSYFQSIKNFKHCTLSSWNGINTYLKMNFSGWQGPYYLYKQISNNASFSDEPSLFATLNIVSTATENSATLKMCKQDSNGDPVYGTDPQTTNIVMNGDGTMGVSDILNDIPVSLTPIWMSFFQSKTENGESIPKFVTGPVLSGTVAGQKVVSSQTIMRPRKVTGKKMNSWDKAMNELTKIEKTLGPLLSAIGSIVSIFFFYDLVIKRAMNQAKKSSKSKEDFDERESEINAEKNQDIIKEATSKEAIFKESAKSVSEIYKEANIELQKFELLDRVNEVTIDSENSIREQLENGETPSRRVEKAISDMIESLEKIKAGSLDNATDKLSKISERIEKTLTEYRVAMNEAETELLSKSSKAISESADAVDSLKLAQEEYENKNKELDLDIETSTEFVEPVDFAI